ncbi:2-haloacid dehalogenase [Streptomyces sp. MnatMP-M77]|uniref:haloacid dehalogenase type II n=1 Tax=unclassified Streptomyces TaxID=2593676 RepID=UPI00080527CC|nr:haloacid dehalogenase type II [Streptomyces sp. MnatMP-M77]MYT76784.1 haloacid dehalogenase type II [Streptomyces sp. SID8364]SBU88009.1 2-haloacid dehalogenase [Streptomyces sp. MnatMP-M77]
MAELKIDAVVFDVLGTLVDEPAGLRAGLRALAPPSDTPSPGAGGPGAGGLGAGGLGAGGLGGGAAPGTAGAAGRAGKADGAESAGPGTERLLLLWQRHIEREQRRVLDGDRPYLPSDLLDREAAGVVAEAAGVEDPAAVEALARSARRLPPWPDTVAGLARIGGGFPLIGLSNASRTALLQLNAHAGLRWHQALSAEDARTYKPDPAVYRLAVTGSGAPPERLLMVAAHAWDLRGAQALGLRTAYVARPVGGPPTAADRFDLHARDLTDLAEQLGLS